MEERRKSSTYFSSSFSNQQKVSADFTEFFHIFFKSLSSISSSVFVYCLDSSNIHYFGNSYLEFEGFELSAINTITVSFQSGATQGTILYMDQGPANGDFFFMKLFILDGALQVKKQHSNLPFIKLPFYQFIVICYIFPSFPLLQYAFCCNEEEEVTWIRTSLPVNDGEVHIVNIRYVFLFFFLLFLSI